MSFAKSYPNLHQWLSHGGLMLVRPTEDGGKIEVLLGDAGGFPKARALCGATPDEALSVAETDAVRRLQMTRQLQQELLADDSPEVCAVEFIGVTGWPRVPNPKFRK
jgi:hypothetical protein